VQVDQQEAAAFMLENGAAVLDGHAPVRQTGRQGAVTDVGSRPERQQAFRPSEPNRLLSDEAMQYVGQVPWLQAAAVTDPYVNGADSQRRLRVAGGSALAAVCSFTPVG
jgi:hypothetical protein